MRIAIDVSPLESNHKLRGIGTYTGQLIEALEKHESQHSYHFFTRGQNIPKNTDLIHYPFFDPFFLTLPIRKVKPTIVTVHDLIPIAFPKHFPKGMRGQVKWQIQKVSLQGAHTIITDSNASKRDIVRYTKVSKNRISVVYLAPSDIFQPTESKKSLTSISRNYSLPNTFILYVGDVNWNKNIEGLILAFDIVRRTMSGIKLVLVGKQFDNAELKETQTINRLIDTLGIHEHIVKLGFIKQEDLPKIYNLASVYVQPSFAEGFGLPILEAMACGCPVVSVNTTSLQEIAGPSSLSLSTNCDNIASAILEVLKMNNIERKIIVEKGLTWVKQFTWKRVARETVSVYEKALE